MDLQKIIKPQPSERWAMYRLICPVVDVACESSGLEPYFEFSRTNGPNRRLSADIALMKGDLPVWLIEAKKYGLKLNPGMVDAYLLPGMMGAVTDGNKWIFKIDGQYLNIGPMLQPDGRVDQEVYRRIVELISTADEKSALALSDAWTDTWAAEWKPIGPKVWRSSGEKGTRAYHPKARYESLAEAAAAARLHAASGSMPAIFLDGVISEGWETPVGYFEVNEARMIWWAAKGIRGARLNLTGKQMELLVHNALIDGVGQQNIKASIKMHDKNPLMSKLKASVPEEVAGLPALFGVNPLMKA